MTEHTHCWHRLSYTAEAEAQLKDRAYTASCCWCGAYRCRDGEITEHPHGPFFVEKDSRFWDLAMMIAVELTQRINAALHLA